jgi:hypothetical protein
MLFEREDMDRSKIRLGIPAQRPEGPAGFGQPAEPAAPDDDRFRAGYSLESGRRAANAIREERAKTGAPAVRAPILIAGLAAVVVLFAVVAFHPATSPNLSYDNGAVLLEYAAYQKGKSRLPSLEQVRRELVGIAYLENTGRTEDAKEALRNLITSMPPDPRNPVYKTAVEQLDSLQ